VSEPSEAAPGQKAAAPPVEVEIEKLRQLLGVADADELKEILRRLDDPEVRARDLSGVLPDAVMLSARTGNRLGDALEPSVQRAVHTAIHRDPKPFARALYPALAPAIRRAISESLRAMVQSLNEILKNTFSLRAFQWRWQAFRTKQSFAEIVLSNSLVYRAQQVFLIHRETGLLLQHVVDPAVQTQDPDLVSSMLTAIQDFVHDSFAVGEDAGLEDFRVGDLTVWIERGRDAVLAAAIRGNAPESLRERLRETLRTVQLGWFQQLTDFSGDASSFDETHDVLQECLVSSYQQPSSRPSRLLWLLIVFLALAIGFWAFWSIRNQKRWASFLERLESAPGIVVTSWEERDGRRIIRGLRDPLARYSVAVLDLGGGGAGTVVYEWESFTSLDEELVLRRATRILEPPPEIDLHLADGRLTATGSASPQWVAHAAQRAHMIPGVDSFAYAGEHSRPSDALRELVQRSQVRMVHFPTLSADMLDSDIAILDKLAADLKELIERAEADGWRPEITLLGHADSTGTEALNVELSQRRAATVKTALVERGVANHWFTVIGVGSSQPTSAGDGLGPPSADRRVSVEVELIAVTGGFGR